MAANTADDGYSGYCRGHHLRWLQSGWPGIGSTGLTNGVNNDQVGTRASPINPQLGPLQNNAGPTDTRALLMNSPAINAGNDALAPAADQRGFSRSGVSDIGAFEFTPSLLRHQRP